MEITDKNHNFIKRVSDMDIGSEYEMELMTLKVIQYLKDKVKEYKQRAELAEDRLKVFENNSVKVGFTAKELAEELDVTPKKIDNLARVYGIDSVPDFGFFDNWRGDGAVPVFKYNERAKRFLELLLGDKNA